MDLPYFEHIVGDRRYGNAAAKTFSRYVHWGVWPQLGGARTRKADFVEAMERLDDIVTHGAKLSDGMAVLDVGCGLGGTLSRVSERLPDTRLVGVNLDHRQLVNAVKSQATFVCADGCALPARSASFDAVLAVECIFHFPSRQEFLTEAARVLKPGGRLSLSDFVPDPIDGQESPVGQWCARQIGKEYGFTAGWPDGDYEAMARRAGLVVEQNDDLTARTLPT
ncbi:MAG: class I SAM-dependent methyltransferase [Frankia sp.]